jgi:hypothetical protein
MKNEINVDLDQELELQELTDEELNITGGGRTCTTSTSVGINNIDGVNGQASIRCTLS